MTDHLEPYRKIAHSIQSMPPNSLTHSPESATEPLISTSGVTASPKHTITEAEVSPAQGTSMDPSEHVAALVHEAVGKPTVLPDTYTILENIGDRISRLTVPQPADFKGVPSEIPQPGSNATSAYVRDNLALPIDPSERIAVLVREAVGKPTVLPTPYTILENIGDRINRLATSKPVDYQLIQPKFPQPVSNEISASVSPAIESPIDSSEQAAALEQETVCTPTVVPAPEPSLENIGDRVSQLTTPEPVNSELIPPEIPHPDSNSTSAETIESQPMEAEIKKPLDDAHLEASASAKIGAEAPLLEQTHSNQVVGVVVEPAEVEEITKEQEVCGEVVVEPVTVEETTHDQGTAAVVAQPVEDEQTLSDEPVTVVNRATDVEQTTETEAPVAEVEKAQAPTLLERVSSIVESVSTAFKQPEADQKDTETVVEPSPSQPATTEDTAVDTAEPITAEEPVAPAEETPAPTLLERVSSIVEAVSTAFKQPKTDQKDTETVVEPSPSQPATTEDTAVDTAEPITSEASAPEVDNSQASSLLDRVSSVDEAVATPLKDSEADQKNSETLVEPSSAASEKASDSKTVEITCPKCESTEIRKNGRRHGKQRYVCKDCGREFVKPSSVLAEDKLEKQASSPVETATIKDTQSDTVSGNSTSESSKALSKKKTKAKGFGGSKKAK